LPLHALSAVLMKARASKSILCRLALMAKTPPGIDVYGSPDVEPNPAQLEHGLVNGHSPPPSPPDASRKPLEPKHPLPHSLVASTNKPEDVGYIPVAEPSHVG